MNKEINRKLTELSNDIVLNTAALLKLREDYRSLVESLVEDIPPELQNTLIMTKEPMHISDRLIAVVRDKDGNVKQEYDSGWHPNGITNVGFADCAGLIINVGSITAFGDIGIGTGTTGFLATQTALIASVKQKTSTQTRVTSVQTNDTAQFQVTFSNALDSLTGTDAITESGVFNATSSGDMLCRQTFSALNVNFTNGDTLTMTWTVKCEQGS